VWCADFEFSQPDGERPAVRCLAASEYHTGRTIRLWIDGEPVPPQAPFDVGPDCLFVAYAAVAEMVCFAALGWPMPARLLDLHTELKWLTCGVAGEPAWPSLVYALERFGLDSLDVVEKLEMRDLAMRQGVPLLGAGAPRFAGLLRPRCGRLSAALAADAAPHRPAPRRLARTIPQGRSPHGA
jgi:hypothetical protein